MFIGDIRQVPTGVVTTVSTTVMKCAACGAIAFNLTYEARATEDYVPDANGKIHRRFDFVARGPLCDCAPFVWLSSDDLPYAVDGWPVHESVYLVSGDPDNVLRTGGA